MCLYRLTHVYSLHVLPINTHMVHVCDVKRVLSSNGPSAYSKFFKITFLTQVPRALFVPTCRNQAVYVIDFVKIFTSERAVECVEFDKIENVDDYSNVWLDEKGISLHNNQIHQQLSTMGSFCKQVRSPSIVLHKNSCAQDACYFLQLRKNELVLGSFLFKHVDFSNPYLFRLEHHVLWFQHCGSIFKLNLRTRHVKHVLRIRPGLLEDGGEQFVFCQFYKKNIVVYDRVAQAYFTIGLLKSAHTKANIAVATTDHFKCFRAWNTHLDGYLQTRVSWPSKDVKSSSSDVCCLKPWARFFRLSSDINVYMGEGGPTHIGRIENCVFVLNRNFLLVFTC